MTKADCHYDVVIVGAGTAGSVIAEELSNSGLNIAVFEKGKHEKKIGTLWDCFRYYDLRGFTKKCLSSREGLIVWQSSMVGGTSVVACGNGTRALESELNELGLDLKAELKETENEMGIRPIEERLLSSRSRLIRESAKAIGVHFENMPKMLNQKLCTKCGDCIYGCKYGAKWTAINSALEAKKKGTKIYLSSIVKQLIVDKNKVSGVIVKSGSLLQKIYADIVICASGSLQSPLLLQRAGITNAGSTLFTDMLANVYGVTKMNFNDSEPTMALVDHSKYKEIGYIISPYINSSRIYRSRELGFKGILLPTNNLIGLMVKIRDDNTGQVFSDGTFSKKPSENDLKKLGAGINIAQQILRKAGVNNNNLFTTKIQGAHPGGTTPIGKIVDNNLQTAINGLYVCDAGVLPVAPGLPTIITIVALAKRLARTIKSL